jgi:hypothetical protein
MALNVDPHQIGETDIQDVDMHLEEEGEMGEDDSDSEDLNGLEDHYVDFLNSMETKFNVPKSSVAALQKDMLNFATAAHNVNMRILKRQLDSTQLSDVEKGQLLAVADNNVFLQMQKKFKTVYKVDQFVTSAYSYVPPVTKKLPPDENGHIHEYQYVPVTETVKNIVSKQGFTDLKSKQPLIPAGVMADWKDGECYRKNPYFIKNPDALSIALYSDEIETANPIGAFRGKQKLLMVYMTLGEIPKTIRQENLLIY